MSTVKNIDRGPQDLADGRVLAPEQIEHDVELTDHERAKVNAGQLLVLKDPPSPDPPRPRPRRSRKPKEQH